MERVSLLLGHKVDWGTLQWYDTSEGADNQWFDFEENEAFYPYDEKLVIRLRDKESIINHLLRLDDTVTRLTLEVAKLQEYNEYVNLSTPKR